MYGWIHSTAPSAGRRGGWWRTQHSASPTAAAVARRGCRAGAPTTSPSPHSTGGPCSRWPPCCPWSCRRGWTRQHSHNKHTNSWVESAQPVRMCRRWVTHCNQDMRHQADLRSFTFVKPVSLARGILDCEQRCEQIIEGCDAFAFEDEPAPAGATEQSLGFDRCILVK